MCEKLMTARNITSSFESGKGTTEAYAALSRQAAGPQPRRAMAGAAAFAARLYLH